MKKNRGFTLIELMIVVAIVGILSAIAYPSYQSALRDSRRVTAEGDLIELASFMERHYTVNSTYTGAALPFTTSPKNSDNVYYGLGVAITASGALFTLTATASGAQASDYCGDLTLDNTDTRGAAVAGCW
ncbi:MAG: type IV pilin protein [Gammaproteobacteria bacterium]|nr:type IV pilin protein [Gammaproteobacteria bacterium]